ncbi:MAG TPA: ribosome biogenesis GTPase Der [bacterium]|nr:ribosome biogenesis GTPase Der [bacterium]
MAISKPSQVIIFGRTNVGKSTLFNRLIGSPRALVADVDHTTRDANQHIISWNRRRLELVDTAGLNELIYLTMTKKKAKELTELEEKIQYQTGLLLKEAAVVLFVVDGQTGLLPQDKELALACKKLLPKNTPLILVANKIDSPRHRDKLSDFFQLGWGQPWAISAATGMGTGDLLDEMVKLVAKQRRQNSKSSKEATEEIDKTQAEEIDEIQTTKSDEAQIVDFTEKPDYKVCLLGKPNVGKSSLLNALLGYDRVLVSSMPHTTREPQDTFIKYKGKVIQLVDTAGIARKDPGKKKILEKAGMTKSLQRLNQSDIAILLVDISEPISHQEANLAEEIVNRKKSLIVAANKWDKVEERDTAKFSELVYHRLPFIGFAPIAFVSAKTKSKVQKILDLIIEVGQGRSVSLSKSQLDHFLSRIVKHHLPAKGKGLKHPHIYSFVQTEAAPPCFTATIGIKDNLHFSYIRFIQNQLRHTYGFEGTPISIHVARGRQINPQHKSNH